MSTQNGSNERSYDLRQAADIAARLRHRERREEPAPEPAPRGYTSFAAAPPARSGGEMAELGEDVPWSDEMAGSEGWGKILEWCVDAVAADCAFVVDDRGLVIASRGNLPNDVVDETGARHLMAFEHTDRMQPDHPSQSITVELGQGWLSGVRVGAEDGERLTIAVQAALPLSTVARRRLESAFQKKMRGI
ncbi:MAG: hypothetical protein KC731_18355 [Myxococcales bacterium]|nr:hypothetical protein [Myxococcales bacterium]